MDRSRDSVLQQDVPHGLARSDQRLHIRALRACKRSCERLAETARQSRHVVMQILFEECVIGRDAGNPRSPGEAHTGVMSDERGMDVEQLDVLEPLALEQAMQLPPPHAPVFRVARNPRRGNPDYCGLICAFSRIVGRDQQCLDAAVTEVCAERADGRGDAVDAREVDVRNE